MPPIKIASGIARITALFWLIGKLITYKLWLSTRLFPLAPVGNFLYAPDWVHLGLFITSLLCLLALLAAPSFKVIPPLLFTLEVLTCLLDQNRWQPWEYQYLFTLVIFAGYRNKDAAMKNVLVFMLAAIYFYGGLSKLNEGFLLMQWDHMILTAYFKTPTAVVQNTVVHLCGYLLGATEALAGIGLLFRPTRKVAAIFLALMHVFILLVVGPLGLRYNISIWPWNVAMIGYLALFLSRKSKVESLKSKVESRKSGTPTESPNILLVSFRAPLSLIALIIWGILPALNYIGLWDNYLSASLYSGKIPFMAVCIDDTTAVRPLKPYLSKTDTLHLCNGQALLNVTAWAMKEMKAPPYPELRVYRQIKAAMVRQYPGAVNSYWVYYYPEARRIPL
jgi:uncharacterized membrane protein YphA (DoxX/SURF4 family)